MSGSSARRWLLAAAVLLFLIGCWVLRAYRTDDTFIFLVYARNLAAGAGPSFNAGEPVYGFSSPLWMLGLALLERLGIGGLTGAKLAALAAGLGALAGLHACARQRLEPGWAAAATLAWAANAWLVRWTAAAMETALFVGLLLWALALVEAERRAPERRRPWAALVLGLAVLARPEGLLFAGLALGVMVVERGREGLRRAGLAAAIIAGLVGPWLAYASWTMGSLLPVTGAAKGTVGLAPGLDPLADVVRVVGACSGVESLLLLAGAALLVAARRRGGRWWPPGAWRGHLLPLLWLLALPAFYAATGFDVLSRYALPVVPVVVVYGFVAARALVAGRTWRATPLAIALLVVALNGLLLARVVYPHARSFTSGVTRCFQGLGEWFAANSEPGAQVAIADVGAFGYYSGRRVLDLAGLMSPELIPLVDRYSIQEIAAELRFAALARPAYLVDRYDRPGRLTGTRGGVFEPLPIAPCAIEGLGVRAPQTIYYTAYRLHWDRYRPGGRRGEQ